MRRAFARPVAPGGERPERASRGLAAKVVLGKAIASEGADYFFLLGVTIFLVLFGLLMVLSSSSVEEMASGGSFFTAFATQGAIAALAVPAMLVASRFPSHAWRRITVWLYGATTVLQLLVFTGLGFGTGGNRSWLRFAGLSLQPAEFAKVAMLLFLARFLADRRNELSDWRRTLLPAIGIAVVPIGLVLVGKDLGTALIMVITVLGLFFFAGVPLRRLGTMLLVTVPLVAIFAQANASRTSRIASWLEGCTPDQYLGDCWQVIHGRWALAAGGIFGVGLGNSKAKWSWLPEADNDFIFAVIGEELGLIGALVVVILFVLLAVAMVRIQSRVGTEPMGRIFALGVVVWLTGQAFVNIGVILGMFPVLGVPLPLISSGGSALLGALAAIAIVLSFARRTTRPEAAPPEPQPVRRPVRGGAR